MLMNELQNPQLGILFDKVMDVAIEFSGSGPVEGPGSSLRQYTKGYLTVNLSLLLKQWMLSEPI